MKEQEILEELKKCSTYLTLSTGEVVECIEKSAFKELAGKLSKIINIDTNHGDIYL